MQRGWFSRLASFEMARPFRTSSSQPSTPTLSSQPDTPTSTERRFFPQRESLEGIFSASWWSPDSVSSPESASSKTLTLQEPMEVLAV